MTTLKTTGRISAATRKPGLGHRLVLLASVAAIALSSSGLARSASACGPDCGGDGFSINVDGERIAGDGTGLSDNGSTSDIQVKFDGLDVRPLLNVSTVDLRRAYQAGERIDFLASLNYPDWVARKEVLIYETGRRATSGPVATLPVDASGHATWTMPGEGEGDYAYVLRVSDDQNRFDETVPLTISRSSEQLSSHQKEQPVAAGYGEDRTAVRNIPVYGGAVTVYGTNVPADGQVTALGEQIPVDRDGSFTVQRILPPGDHQVDVSVQGGGREGLDFSRSVNIPENDWFYVALADLTVGKRFGSGDIEQAKEEDYDTIYTKGRLAFYLKGKIKGRTLLTAAADTGEGRIEDMFRGLDSKDPRQLLRRIDPDSYYPVYGDDSTAIEGAPTDGKFYVRLDRGDSHVMWGRYKVDIDDSKLLRNERTLYGAEAVYRSENSTSFGERKVEAKVYAAQPNTLPQRDVFRGTGGSAYFLKRQDVTRGTETITVVVSDPVSGRILSRRQLIAGEDYDINYLQGVVILKKPLPSTTREGRVVRDGALGDDHVSLVVAYEYTPAIGEVKDYAYGGEAGAWIGEHVRVGVTGMSEEAGPVDQQSGGVNVKLRATDSTFLEAEIATSKGPGFSRSLSTDGGLTNVDELTSGSNDLTGNAWRLRGEMDMANLNPNLKGKVVAWYEQKEAGFATIDDNVAADQRTAGLSASYDVTAKTELRATIEDYEDSDDRTERKATVEAEHQLTEELALALGATYTDMETPGADPGKTGKRVDVGTKVTYAPDDDTELYAFGQVTADRRDGIDRNDRIGVGAKRKLTEIIGVEGEVSTGTGGIGALAALTYDPTADDHYYGGYRLDPSATRNTELHGVDLGGIVIGAKRRYNDMVSAYAENNYDMFGKRRSLTSTYGVLYTPDKFWTVDGGFEAGRIADAYASDFDRNAISLSAGYKDDDRISATAKGEARFEESEDGTRNRDSYLFATAASYKVSEDWRLLSGVDLVLSRSDQASILDGDYVEGNLGFAYRPVEHDRLNALARYQFLYDLPGAQQVTANGNLLGPAQRSHVLSADINYDLTDRISVGGKYGVRFGEVSTTRNGDDFTPSSAQLAILRTDVNIVQRWNALLEARMLATGETETVKYGALAAVYHNVGDNMKVGGGYNFGRFSDDLTDLTYDDMGAFVNVIGKF